MSMSTYNKQKSYVMASKSECWVKEMKTGLTTCEIQCLLYLLQDLHIMTSKTQYFYYDSQSAMHVFTNSVLNSALLPAHFAPTQLKIL